MSEPTPEVKTTTVDPPMIIITEQAEQSPSQPQPQPETQAESQGQSHPQAEWIEDALSIIEAGKAAELQHRQTVADMKSMTEMMDMQAPFPATIMAVSALVRDHPADVGGKAYVEGVLWGVIEELTV